MCVCLYHLRYYTQTWGMYYTIYLLVVDMSSSYGFWHTYEHISIYLAYLIILIFFSVRLYECESVSVVYMPNTFAWFSLFFYFFIFNTLRIHAPIYLAAYMLYNKDRDTDILFTHTSTHTHFVVRTNLEQRDTMHMANVNVLQIS